MSLLSHNLQAFLSVAKYGKVLLAAQHINIGATGVTQRIKALEDELNTTLFIRSRTGMALTPEGEALLNYCLRAIELESETYATVLGGGKDAVTNLTIAGPTSLISTRIIDQCLPLYKRWPLLNLNFLVDDNENRLMHIRNGTAQLSIVRPFEVTPELDSKELKVEEYVLVGPKAWKGRKLEKIISDERILDFSEEDPTTKNYLREFDLINFIQRPKISINNNAALLKLLISGVGYCVLTMAVAKEHLESGELILLNNGKSMKEYWSLAWYKRPQMPKYMNDLITSIT